MRMGTRQLGARPWLIVDEHREAELALKARLLAERRDEVFAAEPDAVEAGAEVYSLVSDELRAAGIEVEQAPDGLHPLDAAGGIVQEDLCLLRRDELGWVLAAASLSFPSRWRLAEKMGLPITQVHKPVDGYEPTLASRVDSLFDRLDAQIVWRRNWFIHPDDSLFQPDRPVDGDPVIVGDECGHRLVIRSERQTLRRLHPSGWILFTIRIQQASLGRFIGEPERRDRFERFLNEASVEHAAHRGISQAQTDALRTALAGR